MIVDVSGRRPIFILQDAAAGAMGVLFWVGFLALFRGFSQIFLAFTVRHAGHEAGAALGEPTGPS